MNSSTWFNKFISVAISVVLWVYVIIVVNPTSKAVITGVPVQLLNREVLAASNLAIAGTDYYTVDVFVEGARSDISALQDEQVSAMADLFGMGKGQNYLVVSVSVPEKITVTEVRTSRIPILIDELVDVSRPVRIAAEDIPKDREIGAVSLQPEEIIVSGAKSIVDQVSHVRVELSGEDLGPVNTRLELTAEAVGATGEIIKDVRLSQAYVEVNAALHWKKTVPLEVPVEGEPALSVELTGREIPSTIVIKGELDLVGAVEAVVAEPLNIRGIEEDTILPILPILPAGIDVADASRDLKARFSVTEVAEARFDYEPDEVYIFNEPAGHRIRVLTGGISISVRGDRAVVRALTREDLQPAVDGSALLPGMSEVPLLTRYKPQLVKLTIMPPAVRVDVREVPGEEEEEE